MNLNNESGNIAKSGAKVGIIFCNSNTEGRNGKDDTWIVIHRRLGRGLRLFKVKDKSYFDIDIDKMKTTEIKLDLHNKIDSVAGNQLKEIYGLVMNYLNGNSTTEEWELFQTPKRKRSCRSLNRSMQV